MANTLIVVVAGCEHSVGLSKKDDTPYNFAQLNYLVPNTGWKSAKGHCKAYGLTQKQMSMSANPTLLAEFDKIQFPARCVLTLEPDPENPQRNLVTDFKLAEIDDEL
jgi:hypothetical protein